VWVEDGLTPIAILTVRPDRFSNLLPAILLNPIINPFATNRPTAGQRAASARQPEAAPARKTLF
jgi:hypothetical protein